MCARVRPLRAHVFICVYLCTYVWMSLRTHFGAYSILFDCILSILIQYFLQWVVSSVQPAGRLAWPKLQR